MDRCFCHLNGLAVKDATARKITDNFVIPEMFGAKGDGVTDDSAAINEALNCGKPVLLRGVYAVGAGMSGNAPEICGMGAKIILLNDVDQVFRLRGTNCFSGLRFNCMNHGAKSCVTISDVEAVEIYDIHIQDVKDMRTDSGSELICAYEIPTVNIHDVHIENCVHKPDGNIGNSEGNISGIYVHGHTKQCVLQNITGKEIHNIDDSGNIVFEDSNLIYVHTQDKTAETICRNIYGYNFGKRLIKTQCAGTVFIDGVKSYTDCADHLVTIGIQNIGSEEYGTAIITNCELVNGWNDKALTQYLISTNGKADISNCRFVTKYQIAIHNEGDLRLYGCAFEGNGIYNCGRTLNVDNVDFCGTTVICDVREIGTKTIVKNSRIEANKDYNVNYGCLLFCGDTEIYNTSVKGGNITFSCEGHAANVRGLKMENCGNDAITVSSGSATLADVSAISEDSITRFINVIAGASATVRNITISGYAYSFIGGGSLDILGGVDLKKVLASSYSHFANYPEYISELPNPANMAEGAKAILISDNKLYKVTSGEWVAT